MVDHAHFHLIWPGDLDLWPLTSKLLSLHPLVHFYLHTKFGRDRIKNERVIESESRWEKKNNKSEPVGEPYREVCLSPWKGSWRMSENRIDWRNVLLSEKNYFHEKELKENRNMTLFMTPKGHRVIRGRRDLLYDPKGHGDLSSWFDLVYDPLRSRGH